GVTAVRGEVEVVRIVNRNRTARTAGTGIDRCQGVTHVVVHVQGLQVMRRSDVLRQGPDCEVIHDLEGVRIDDVDRVSGAVGHVDAGRIAPGDRLDHPGLVVRVEVEPAGGGRSAAVHEIHGPLNRLRHGTRVAWVRRPVVLPDRAPGDRRDGRQQEYGTEPDKRTSPRWST